jgi:hypothetical protein
VVLFVAARSAQAQGVGDCYTFMNGPPEIIPVWMRGWGGDPIIATAQTFGGYCQGEVEVWIDGISNSQKSCDDGFLGDGACRDYQILWWEDRALAAQRANIEAWGRFRSYAYHWLIYPDNGVWINFGVSTDSLDLGNPPSNSCDTDGGTYCDATPIVLPVGSSNAVKFTSAADGVYFDIDGDGLLDRVGWTTADSDVAFLALDRNDNGIIDDGTELFGNHTVVGAPNGYAALATFASDADGDIDALDAVFSHLLLWVDRNHDGISQIGELMPASNVYAQIGLGYVGSPRRDGPGNQYRFKGWARDLNGRLRHTYDVFVDQQ